MSIFSVTSSAKLLTIRARTNNKCVFCGQFVGLDEQSFEHLYNKKENKEWLKAQNIGDHSIKNLAIAHDKCNASLKQDSKSYDYVAVFNSPTMENDKKAIVKAFIGLYISNPETAYKFAFNRYEEKYNVKGELKNAFLSELNQNTELKSIEYNRRKQAILNELSELDNEFLG